MSSTTKLAILPPESNTKPKISVADLIVDTSYDDRGGVKQLLTHVPVKKPSKTDFIRVSPDTAHRVGMYMITIKGSSNAEDTYAVLPKLIQLIDPKVVAKFTLFLAINRQRIPFIWPVRVPATDAKANEWHTSAREAAEMAMSRWVRVVANMARGSYDISVAEAELSPPEWPEEDYPTILDIAFKGKIVDSDEHAVVQQMRGLV
jgi:hypothetical protein